MPRSVRGHFLPRESWSVVGEKRKHDSYVPGGMCSRFLLSWKPYRTYALSHLRCPDPLF